MCSKTSPGEEGKSVAKKHLSGGLEVSNDGQHLDNKQLQRFSDSPG